MCTNTALAIDSRAEDIFTVTDMDLATRLGSGDVGVLGTPRVIQWMEQVTVQTIQPFLSPECTTVGIHIDVRHVAPSVVGSQVRIASVVSGVRATKIEFSVSAMQGTTLVAQGVITRAHVDRNEFELTSGV